MLIFVYFFQACFSIAYLINLSLRFLGHCVEFNLQGGVIQDQYASPCNDTFPKCDKYYNSSTAYKCNVIINITLKYNLCHLCYDRRLIDQTPGSGSDLKLKLKNLHFLNVFWLKVLTKLKWYQNCLDVILFNLQNFNLHIIINNNFMTAWSFGWSLKLFYDPEARYIC